MNRALVVLLAVLVLAGVGVDFFVISIDGDTRPTFEEVVVADSSPVHYDTDADGLPDGEELERGTDPTDRDTDGDWLYDGWEVEGVAPNGQRLHRSDPLRRNLYLEFGSLQHAESPTRADIQHVATAFEEMPVSNPDGSEGITVVTRGPRRFDVSVRDLHDRTDSSKSVLTARHFQVLNDASYLESRAGIYHLVLIVPQDAMLVTDDPAGQPSGVGEGKVAVYRWPSREGMVHEILHTIVGEAFTERCDGVRHACRGYLSHADGDHFAEGTIGWLENNSYYRSSATLNGTRYE